LTNFRDLGQHDRFPTDNGERALRVTALHSCWVVLFLINRLTGKSHTGARYVIEGGEVCRRHTSLWWIFDTLFVGFVYEKLYLVIDCNFPVRNFLFAITCCRLTQYRRIW